jgi:YHS domain-containing protein
MKRSGLPSISLAAILAVGLARASAQQPGEAGKSPTTQPVSAPPKSPDQPVLCPVTGKPIDRAIVTRFRGKWVYFANDEARAKFEKDPYEYADKLQDQWAADKPLRVQVKCPVTGERPAPDIYVGQGDDAIFFASDDAKQKWVKDSAPYQKRLESDCYTFQTGCATCGGPINPAASREIDGHTVYLCCDGCATELTKDKSGYLKQVDEQIRVNRAAWIKRAIERQLGAPPKKEAETKPAEKVNG